MVARTIVRSVSRIGAPALVFLLVMALAPPAFAAAPTISSFSPTSGPVGTVVTITGTGFDTATNVKIGNKNEAFTINSATSISATVAQGTQSGPVQVTNPDGTATSTGDFTVTSGAEPTISSFNPTSGAPGTSVTITGTNLTGATSVVFNLTNASAFTVDSSTQITATVANGTTTGPIHVTTPSGTATSSSSFTVPGTPVITSFSPTSGAPGTSVTINGSNLTGATQVKFGNGVATEFTVDNPNKITAVVPSTATTGKISVTTPNGTNQSATDFTVVAPGITSFDPGRGPWGTVVTITGTAFTGATAVRFGGTNASSFTVNSATQITATVANGTETGKITVVAPSGTLTSTDDFIIQHQRSITLSLSRRLVASGKVTCLDGTTECASGKPVKIQRRVSGSWKTVGTTSTDASGNYSVSISNKDGKYRAIALRRELANGDRCVRTKSSVVNR